MSSKIVFEDEHKRHQGLVQLLTTLSDKSRASGSTTLSVDDAEYLLIEVHNLLITHDEIQVSRRQSITNDRAGD